MSQNKNQNQNPYYNTQTTQATQNTLPSVTSQNPYIGTTPTMQGVPNMQNTQKSGFSTSEILTGALIGAAATYVLTNENVQKVLFKGALSIGDIFNGGLDEMKERFEDAKAEREAQKEA